VNKKNGDDVEMDEVERGEEEFKPKSDDEGKNEQDNHDGNDESGKKQKKVGSVRILYSLSFSRALCSIHSQNVHPLFVLYFPLLASTGSFHLQPPPSVPFSHLHPFQLYHPYNCSTKPRPLTPSSQTFENCPKNPRTMGSSTGRRPLKREGSTHEPWAVSPSR
jgi:hypothetical protein